MSDENNVVILFIFGSYQVPCIGHAGKIAFDCINLSNYVHFFIHFV